MHFRHRPLRSVSAAGVLATALAWTLASATIADAQVTPITLPALSELSRTEVYGPVPETKSGGPLARIGYALALLYHEYQDFESGGPTFYSQGRFVPSDDLVRQEGGFVVLDAVATGDAAALASQMMSLGAREATPFNRVVSAIFPIDALPALAAVPDLALARPARMTTNVGVVTTQGDAAMRSDDVRTNFSLNGTGVTVGTLSDSYNDLGGAANDVTNGDLPAGINVLEDDAPGMDTDEGRGMMQHIADVAPGAAQAFHTAFKGQANFAQGIIDLMNAGCDVINDDIIYFEEPFFSDGVIAQAVDQVRANGIPYFSAALNYARQSYEATYRNSGTNPAGLANRIGHDFDPGAGVDIYQSITIPANTRLRLTLQWDQPYAAVSGAPGCGNDVDIFLYNAAANAIVAQSTDNNVGGDPSEFLTFNNVGAQANFNIVIGWVDIPNVADPAPGLIKYIYFSGCTVNEYNTNSPTSFGHPNAAGAIGMAAAYVYNTPEFGVTPPVAEGFSSVGGVPILFDLAGNPVNIIRQRPLITAPDGGNTSFFGSDVTDDADAFPNFFGTSAAAPHAAAVAALMLDYNPALTPANIENALIASAIDMNDPFTPGFDNGFDFKTGHGLIQADDALCSLDTGPPTVNCSLTASGPVSAACDRVLNFTMTATDDLAMTLADFTYNISIPGGGAQLDPAQITTETTSPDGRTVTRTGTIRVSALTDCSATIRLEVDAADRCGNAASTCTSEVQVTDETPAAITCPADITVECSGHCSGGGVLKDDAQLTGFFAGVSATDNCDAALSITDDAPNCFPLGATVVTFTAVDNCGNPSTCQATVTVVDTTPPEIDVTLNRDVLWPPNHKLADIVATVTVTDICCPTPTYRLVSVTSNEPDDGHGDGATTDDIVILDDTHIQLRSERSGGGDGRIYTLTYEAEDCSGNTALDIVRVRVPHDQSGHAMAAVGFAADGAALLPDADRYVLVVTSEPGFEASKVVANCAYVGDTYGALRPTAWLLRDVDGDRDVDLALSYAVEPTQALRRRSKGETLGLHYAAGGVDYLVSNIFELGTPIALPDGDVRRLTQVEVATEAPDGVQPEASAAGGTPTEAGRPDASQLDKSGDGAAHPVVIEVYSVAGRRVRTLTASALPATSAELRFDGRGDDGQRLPSGVYFFKVRGQTNAMPRKLIVVK